MKTPISLVFLLLISFSICAQNVWIADNRPTAPTGSHIFTNVTDAIAAAGPGDIIHVIPSQTFYPNFTVNVDSLTFFGVGFNPQKDQPNKTWVSDITIGTGVFGTRISGINVDNDLIIGDADGSTGNIFIENGDINRIVTTSAGSATKALSNVVIRNCVIGQRETAVIAVIDLTTEASPTSIVITNNIIMGTSSSTSGGFGAINVADAIIKNNLFLGNGGNDNAFSFVTTSTISNNIFLGRSPISHSGSLSNSTFSHNLTFSAATNTFPIGSNGITGSGNIEATDPELVNIPAQDNWDFAFDFTFGGTSPAVGAGNDGTDIGPTGGTIPFSLSGSPLPVITILRLPEIIQQGNNVDATIEAEGN